MYQHILSASEGSDLAQKAVDMGLSLAKAHRARVRAITASEPSSIAPSSAGVAALPFDAYERAAASAAAKILAPVGKLANQLAVECATAHVKEQPADGFFAGCPQQRMRFDCHGLKRPTRPFAPAAREPGLRVLTPSAVPVLICK
jgi:Universal stress protein family